MRIPSSLSALQCGPSLLLYDGSSDRLAATITSASSDAVLLRLTLGPRGPRVVARGDLLDPRWRSWLATDIRLCFSDRKRDRTDILRFLTDAATLWDSHTSAVSAI